MDSFAVIVNFNVIEKLCVSIFERVELSVFEHLVFDGAEARLHERVIVAVTPARHALDGADAIEPTSVCSAAVLTAPIAVGDETARGA